MIDHLAARQALATSVDFDLDATQGDSLAAHLRHCTACRAFDASLRADAAVLRELDFGPVPIDVRANVAIAAEGRGGGLGRWLALVAVGAMLLMALGTGVLGVGGSRTDGPGDTVGLNANANAVHWLTNVVEFQAADFAIEANGQRFTAPAGLVAVSSDPGNATYRTLEATWQEHGVEMRINLYFAGDASSWWVSEIRIYDGKAPGEWITWADGTWFKTPLGAAWAGDLDLAAAGGSLHIGGLVLRSVPVNGVNVPAVGAPAPVVPPNGTDPNAAPSTPVTPTPAN